MLNTLSEECTSCMLDSTAHAIPKVANSEEKISVRIFWRIMWPIALFLFCIHFYSLLDSFLSEPVSTSINYNKVQFNFPDVTICSFLPFSFSLIEKHHHLNDFVKNLPTNEHLFDNLTRPYRLHSHNLILQCSYNYKSCSYRNFTVIDDSSYKPCFVFRPNERKIVNSGPDYGLKLTLFVDNRHKHELPEAKVGISGRQEGAGILVAIHREGTHPHPAVNGLEISPGVLARVAMSYSENLILKKYVNKLSSCINEDISVQHCNLHTHKVDTYRYETGPLRE